MAIKKTISTTEKLKNAVKKILRYKADTPKKKIIKATALPIVSTMWLASWAAIDNMVLRKLTEKFSNIKTEKSRMSFLAKHPKLYAHILYYGIGILMIYSGSKLTQDSATRITKDAQSHKKQEQVENEYDLKIKSTETYEEFLNQYRSITPYLIGYLVNPEGFESKVYQDGRGVWTIGYGSTRMPDGPVGPNTPDITIEKAYEIARWHIEDYETYFNMYCYCCAFDRGMTNNEFLGLASFMYNGGPGMFEPNVDTENGKPGKNDRSRNERWAELRSLYRKQGTISRQQIKEVFAKYPVVVKGSVLKAWLNHKSGREIGQMLANYLRSGGERAEGLVWRRWLEAGLTSGDINPLNIMNTPIGGIYEFRQYLKSKNLDMISKNNIINYSVADTLKIWIKNPQYWDKQNNRLCTPKDIKLTKSVMPKKIVALCESGKCYIPNKSQTYNYDDSSKTYNYTDSLSEKETKDSVEYLIELGTKYLYDKNYEKAEEVYIKAIKKYPQYATAYSDLSYLYLKLGKYEKGIAIVNMLEAQLTKSMNVNALAGAYYNAGLCYKNMGGVKNLKLAKIYMEKAQKQLPKVKVYQKEIDNINAKLVKNIEKSKDVVKKKAKFDTAKAKTIAKKQSVKPKPKQKTR